MNCPFFRLSFPSIVLGAQFPLEGIEPTRPDRPRLFEPGFEIPESAGVEGLDAGLPLDADGHKPRLVEHLQMLGNRRGAHVELIDKFAGRPFANGEQFDNPPARRVGDGVDALHAGNN